MNSNKIADPLGELENKDQYKSWLFQIMVAQFYTNAEHSPLKEKRRAKERKEL